MEGFIYLPVCSCMQRERTGEGGVVLYVLSSVSLYACVCEWLFLSVVMTVVLGHRCFDSLSKHKRMWLGWRQGGIAPNSWNQYLSIFYTLNPVPAQLLVLHIASPY